MTGPRRHAAVDGAALDRLNRIGGRAFLLEMIELFLEHAPQRLATARAAFEGGDFPGVYGAAHSLKSTAGNLGARALQDVAERAEERAAAEDGAAIGPLLDEMERRYEEIRVELEAEHGRRKGKDA